MNELRLPTGINYECTACGKCCGGWAVPMTETDYDRISDVDWGRLDDRFAGAGLFRQLRRYEKANTPYTHKIVSDTGVCPFLVDNLCFIHSKNGSEFKPSICQLFPYCFSVTPSGVYATVSYVSQGAVYNSGLPLSQQQDLLERKYAEFRSLYPEHSPDWSAIQLTVQQPMTWDDYLRHEEVVLAILSSPDGSLKDKLVGASDYLHSQVAKAGQAADTTDGAKPLSGAEAVQFYSRRRLSPDHIPLKDLDLHLLAAFHKMYFPTRPLKQGEGDFNALRFIGQKVLGSTRLQFPAQEYSIA